MATPTSSATIAEDSGLNDAKANEPRAADSAIFTPEASERVMEKISRLPLVYRACQERCSFTIDHDERLWHLHVGADRSPAPVTPLHLFTVLVEPSSEKAIGVMPGAMYGFCLHPIRIENWDQYAAPFERDWGGKMPEPECPTDPLPGDDGAQP